MALPSSFSLSLSSLPGGTGGEKKAHEGGKSGLEERGSSLRSRGTARCRGGSHRWERRVSRRVYTYISGAFVQDHNRSRGTRTHTRAHSRWIAQSGSAGIEKSKIHRKKRKRGKKYKDTCGRSNLVVDRTTDRFRANGGWQRSNDPTIRPFVQVIPPLATIFHQSWDGRERILLDRGPHWIADLHPSRIFVVEAISWSIWCIDRGIRVDRSYGLPGAACGLLKGSPLPRSILEYDLRVTCAAARHASHRYEWFARRTGHRSRKESRAAADFSTLTLWTRDIPFPSGRTRYTAITGGERERERERQTIRIDTSRRKEKEVVDLWIFETKNLCLHGTKSLWNEGRSDSNVVDPFVRQVENGRILELESGIVWMEVRESGFIGLWLCHRRMGIARRAKMVDCRVLEWYPVNNPCVPSVFVSTIGETGLEESVLFIEDTVSCSSRELKLDVRQWCQLSNN